MPTTITTTIAHHVTYNSAGNNPLSIASTGAILASDGYAALTLGTGIEWTVTNSGTVANTASGNYSGNGIDATLATITNTGLIASAYRAGVYLGGNASAANAVVINSGTITDSFTGTTVGATNLYGAVYMHGAGEVTNQSNGYISGAHNGIFGRRLYHGASIETVTNAGRVLGGNYGVGAAGELTLTNSGTISGGIAGVVGAAHGTNPTNTGLSIITNDAGGLIEGGKYGVTVAGPGNTVVNAGTISGASAAVLLARGYDNRLIDEPGAVFQGVVDGGNPLGALGTIATLEFASGSATGTAAGLGLAGGFTNFAAINVDAGADWVFSGTNTVAANATLVDSGNLTLAAGSVLGDGGAITLANSLAGTGTVEFSATGLTLTVGPGAGLAPTIAGFHYNTIALVGVRETISGFGGGNLTLGGAAAMTLAFAGAYSGAGAFNASYDTTNRVTMLTAPCFAEGCRIVTARGAVAVEALAVGDRIVTASGRLAPVAWLGHRRTNLKHHPSPHDVMPVRVRAGAFGPGRPHADLVLSPDHAVLVEGDLIPIRHLINGCSIVQETRDTVTYWHVELDRHDVILAEGLACESYLDTGNRAAFESADGPTQLHPDFARRVWAQAGCAPILTDPADPTLRARHLRLLVRAAEAMPALAAAG